VEEEIDVADKPIGVAVNPNTNKIYAIHQTPSSPSLSVIDGNNNNILKVNITVGKDPVDVAVNPNTSKVYVANAGDDTVSVIDGETYQVINASIAVGDKPIRIAVNPNTNKVYVTNKGSDTVSVINGEIDQVINKPINLDEEPFSIAVNPNANKVYVGYSNHFHYSVINGKNDTLLHDTNNETTKINVNYACPSDIAINQEKNHAYVSFDCQDDLFLITESDKGIPITINTLGTNNTNIAFNSGTDKIYVVDTESDVVYVKDESELT
jgi:YVTN family beta-propeller protein